ncbi:MAG: hypothetical protein U0797_16640 [Gemmataceae bacterium]
MGRPAAAGTCPATARCPTCPTAGRRDPKAGLTVDEVELLVEAFPVRKIDGRWELKAGSGEWQERLGRPDQGAARRS